MKDLFSLEGKVAVVTGGSRGIGAMIARGYIENGAKTYITSRNAEVLEATARQFSEYGHCVAIQSDLSTLDGISSFTDKVMKAEGSVDILVNNAGVTSGASFCEFSEDDWEKVMALNVKSVFFLTQKLLPGLRKAASSEEPARIINIASINGLTHSGRPNYAYSSSKAALIHLTRHLAVDLAADNINVNAIAPGLFRSEMTAGLLNQSEKTILQEIPRRRLGQPEDIAGAAIFLASRASSWIIGQTVVVDGGSVAAAG